MKIFDNFSRSRRVSSALCAACLLCLCGIAVAREPLFQTVAVAALVVEPQPLENVPTDVEQQKRIRILEEQLAEHVQHWLLKRHLAGVVTTATRPDSPSVALRQPILSGTVRLPISLPRGLQSRREPFHKERFTTAQVTMRFPDGTEIKSEAVLDGKDIHLTKRLKQQLTYSSGVNWILERYAEKTIDRALEQLLKQVSS